MIEETCKTMGALQGRMSKSQARRDKMKEMNPGNVSIPNPSMASEDRIFNQILFFNYSAFCFKN
ncbi:MAG: hypothetical protein ACFFBW_10635 [Promethearchaeota archaeon]